MKTSPASLDLPLLPLLLVRRATVFERRVLRFGFFAPVDADLVAFFAILRLSCSCPLET